MSDMFVLAIKDFKMDDEILWDTLRVNSLNHKQLETHGCVLSTVATDALVLKHQAISIHSAD